MDRSKHEPEHRGLDVLHRDGRRRGSTKQALSNLSELLKLKITIRENYLLQILVHCKELKTLALQLRTVVSAQTKIEANVSSDILLAHISFSRSSAYRSAAASRCCIMSIESPCSSHSGNSSVYMNPSIALNVAGSMSCSVMDDVASAVEPKSPALNTGERAATIAR
ncbi:LOW QUALITY PROTEIN: hypothetical protein U9M48_038199 [Paspalum notatum var. saurae]|uniref:Uncharacterized protein n=1 Tax=Paspalum notatum var. saurae TaxID=547442 RepID=A0AAQ3XBE8_PASNO